MHAKSNSDLEAILLSTDLLLEEEGDDPRELIFRLEHIVIDAMKIVHKTESIWFLDDILELSDLTQIVHYNHELLNMKHLFFHANVLKDFEINKCNDIHDFTFVIINLMISAARVLRAAFEEGATGAKYDAARALCAVRKAWDKLY